MITQATLVRDRAAILAATGDHPYARLQTGNGGTLTGYLFDDTVLWTGPSPRGTQAYAMGDGEQALRLVGELVASGVLPELSWLHLPRVPADVLAGHVRVTKHDDWDFRWAVNPPPAQPAEPRVVRLTDADHPAIDALVDAAFPTSTTRPGDPRVRHWYGVWSADRLVACGADRSRGGVGFLAGLTVAPDARGQGLGAALTAAMTRDLLDEAEEVTLGVLVDNHGAIRLYERLGFTGSAARTSVALG